MKIKWYENLFEFLKEHKNVIKTDEIRSEFFEDRKKIQCAITPKCVIYYGFKEKAGVNVCIFEYRNREFSIKELKDGFGTILGSKWLYFKNSRVYVKYSSIQQLMMEDGIVKTEYGDIYLSSTEMLDLAYYLEKGVPDNVEQY